MLIKDLYKQKETVISFEIFPPKVDSPIETIYRTIDELRDLKPDFISVTYGSGGGNRDRTVEIASLVKNKYLTECLAHLTCITSTPEDTSNILQELERNGIRNVLALRGDMPEAFTRTSGMTYSYAKDLVGAIKKQTDFSIGAAAYPEGHISCGSLDQDIDYLKEKVNAGVDFLITQLFFDNELMYQFRDKLAQKGVDIPISAGIMPVLNKNQINRIIKLSGATLPAKFKRMMDKYEDNPEALKEAAIVYATEQIVDLLSAGIDGIHIYTMNKAEVARKIVNNITEIRYAIK